MHSRLALAVVCILVFALAGNAHPVPFSYVDVQLHGAAVDLGLTIHIYDLAHDLQITPMERLLDGAVLKEQDAAIRRLLGPRLAFEADGRVLVPEWLPPEILQDRQSVRFHLRYPSGMPGMVALSTVMFPYDPNHQTFVNV